MVQTHRRRREGLVAHVGWPALALLASTAVVAYAQTAPPGDTKGGVREFVPGVRIDWTAKTVLVDAKVVLKKGPLELVACSPKTREHESILVAPARPMYIFQAMGLIGLSPGKPLSYDERNNKWLPPSGDAVDILVRCQEAGHERPVPIAEWLEVVETKEPPADVEWVFSGSLNLPDGRFAADVEGTLICVVDFEAALIAIRALHTADNEMLWLRARTEAIPPVGTACTLLIRAGSRSSPEPPAAGVEKQVKPDDNAAPDGGDPGKR